MINQKVEIEVVSNGYIVRYEGTNADEIYRTFLEVVIAIAEALDCRGEILPLIKRNEGGMDEQ